MLACKHRFQIDNNRKSGPSVDKVNRDFQLTWEILENQSFTRVTHLFLFFNRVTGGELFDDIVSRELYSERCAWYVIIEEEFQK